THVLNQLDVSELKGEKGDTGDTGPAGAKGDTGVVGIYSLSEGVFIPANSDTGTKYLTCDEDDLALSGGFSYPQGSRIEVVESQPGTSDRNWSFKAHNTSNTEKAVNLHVKCLRVS